MNPSKKTGVKKSLQAFFALEAAGGYCLLMAIFLAILAYNIPALHDFYTLFVHMPIGVTMAEKSFTLPLNLFVQEILMIIFFFIIGLELKKEMVQGVLQHHSQRILPLYAALGGMIVPSLIYLAVVHDVPVLHQGWAIPAATDIAFAIGIFTLIQRFISPSAKIILLAIAVYDDLLAMVILAIFYSQDVQITYFILPIAMILALFMLHRLHVVKILPYVIVGGILAYGLHHAGFHSTLAGVITALAVPFYGTKEDSSPVKWLIHHLHPLVSYGILPLFAFVQMGISINIINMETLLRPLTLAIMLGLFLGKQIGIFGVLWILIKGNLIKMPENTAWQDLYSVAILAGIGFTMSLFVGLIAFTSPEYHQEIKLGVLVGSSLSAIWAMMISRVLFNRTMNNNFIA